jgi:hypothetical protein
MTLKLVDNKVLIKTMFVPELKEHTFLEYEFERNSNHLHPVLTINGETFAGNHIFINLKNIENTLHITLQVELLDDQHKVIHIYQSKVEYNVYQVLGNKPIRPDIEQYLYQLEKEIRVLKETLINETNRLNMIIVKLEEKGEIV